MSNKPKPTSRVADLERRVRALEWLLLASFGGTHPDMPSSNFEFDPKRGFVETGPPREDAASWPTRAALDARASVIAGNSRETSDQQPLGHLMNDLMNGRS
jgi:hypothetical protein